MNSPILQPSIDTVVMLLRQNVPVLLIKYSMQNDPLLNKHCDTIIRWAKMKLNSEKEC